MTNITIKLLASTDASKARELIELMQRVFGETQSTISQPYLINLLSSPYTLCFAAMADGAIIGGLTAYLLPMYDREQQELFIYNVAVLPAFQRQGIGKQLIETVKSYCADHHISQAFVDAHAVDEHALDFYRSVGGREDKVIQFTFDVPQN